MLGAAAELRHVSIEDSLAILELIAVQDPALYPRAAARWMRRLASERDDLTLAQIRLAVAALDALADDPTAAEVLRALSRTGL